jgi:hypothetical protein
MDEIMGSKFPEEGLIPYTIPSVPSVSAKFSTDPANLL